MFFSLLLGGLTHHYIGSSLPYCNTVNDLGTIQHAYAAGMIGNKNFQAGIIMGKDSACGNIAGPITSTRINKNFAVVLGGYNTNYNDFRKRGIEPPSIKGITPIAGLDYSIHITNNISLDTVVSIGIITHGIKITLR